MVRYMKKLLTIIALSFAMAVCFAFSVGCSNNTQTPTPPPAPPAPDYEYSLNQNETGVILTKYIGDAEELTKESFSVPAQIDDLPVVELGKNLFRKAGFVTVTLPDTLTVLGQGSFNSCASLQSINTSKVEKFSTSCFEGCSQLTTIDLSSAKTISNKAFYNCKNLIEVSIPNTVSTIGSSAFSSCNRLITVNLGEGVKKIEDDAFSGCSALSNIDLSHVETFGTKAFQACVTLKSINLDSAVLLPVYVFERCNALETVILGKDLILVFKETFFKCLNLKSVEFKNPYYWISVGCSANWNPDGTRDKWPGWMTPDSLLDPAANVSKFTYPKEEWSYGHYYAKLEWIKIDTNNDSCLKPSQIQHLENTKPKY